MCTVTYVPTKDKVLITSNRDEHISRRAVLVPSEELSKGKKIVYPKDSAAGGTWFAMNERGMTVVLLNGAFANHDRKAAYRKSRGVIVLEIISSSEPLAFLNKLDLENIEPFTLIMFNGFDLWEFRWDGDTKYFDEKDSSQSYIWSSWTLYGVEAQSMRNDLFKEFISNNQVLERDGILDFHQNNHGDFENGFIIDRKNGLKTLSITQAIFEKDTLTMNHFDLSQKQKKSVLLKRTPPLQTVYES